MSYFVACFGAPHGEFRNEVRTGLRELLGIADVRERHVDQQCSLFYGRVTRFASRVVDAPDGAWLVADGIVIDTKSPDGAPTYSQFLADSLGQPRPDTDRYEGAFALSMWDASRSQGWFFNDHCSVRNLYYIERDGVTYVTTAPVVLAKTLGLALDEFGVKQLLARGCVLAPTSLFAGLRRLCVGEVGQVADGRLTIHQNWLPLQQSLKCRFGESVDAFVSVLSDRLQRLRTVAPASIGDLTGGLDSRLVNLAQHAIGAPVHTTVNGADDDLDVIIAKELAQKMGWDLLHFPRNDFPTSSQVRREVTIRSGGELPFDRLSFHLATRPSIGETYDVTYGGVGGELLRYYPWSHEFLNIGRRKRANVDRTLRYRYALFGEPPRQLFAEPWFDAFQAQIADAIGAWFDRMPGSLTTQQQDALYVWKMTSHGSLWSSATSVWLPSASPFLFRGCVDVMVAIPWRHKLSSKLQRAINEGFSPAGAAIRTAYGASGGRWGWKDVPAVVGQTYHQSTKLAEKVLRVLRRKGRMKLPSIPPFITEEFRDFLTPANMVTADYYEPRGLAEFVAGDDAQLAKRSIYLARIATIEHVARALR